MTTLISPVKHFAGEVELHDPLTLPMVVAWEKGIEAVKALPKDSPASEKNQSLMPGVLACVKEWRLQNFPVAVTVDTFPGSPAVASMQLVGWLIGEILKIYQGNSDPNE